MDMCTLWKSIITYALFRMYVTFQLSFFLRIDWSDAKMRAGFGKFLSLSR